MKRLGHVLDIDVAEHHPKAEALLQFPDPEEKVVGMQQVITQGEEESTRRFTDEVVRHYIAEHPSDITNSV